MSKMRLFGAVALSLVLASASVQAATSTVAQIGNFHGKVLVNQGEGFLPVSGPLALKAGDTVMIGDQSFATVTYNNKCSVALSSPTVLSVSDKAPCAKGENVAAIDGAFVAPTFAPPPPVFLPLILVGGIATTVGIIVLTKHKKKSPAASAP